MKSNQQLIKINRNFVIGFIASVTLSAVIAQLLENYESYLITTITMILGYMIFFGIFSGLFYFDNHKRYKEMESRLVRKELFKLISSFGFGEIVYLGIRWPTFYYFLEINLEPFLASIISELIGTACYMIVVTIFLRKTRTF